MSTTKFTWAVFSMINWLEKSRRVFWGLDKKNYWDFLTLNCPVINRSLFTASEVVLRLCCGRVLVINLLFLDQPQIFLELFTNFLLFFVNFWQNLSVTYLQILLSHFRPSNLNSFLSTDMMGKIAFKLGTSGPLVEPPFDLM